MQHAPSNARHLLRCGFLVGLILLAPCVLAAGFAPGREADPPTGQAPIPEEQAQAAAEPLRAPGIAWEVRGVRLGGQVALEGRVMRDEEGRRLTQTLLHTELQWRGYVWQPWFAQVRLGVGALFANDRGEALFADGSSRGVSLTGHGSLSLFPASRFPFELRALLSDSRTSGDYIGTDVQTRRISISQGYQPLRSSDRYQFQADYSRFEGRGTADTLETLFASYNRHAGAHHFELSGNAARNQNDFESSRNYSLFARHGFVPGSNLSIDTVASWNVFEYGGASDELLDARTDFRQISTIGTWRPAPGDPLYVEHMPMSVIGSARWVDAGFGVGGAEGSSIQTVNGTLGATVELSPAWRLGASATGGRSQAAAGNAVNAASGNVALSWTPEGAMLGEWRYAPNASLSLGASRDGVQGNAWQGAVALGHSVSRSYRLGESQSLAFSLSQSVGTLRDSRLDMDSRAISHSAGISWQASEDDGSQTYASLTANDSRTRTRSDGTYQFASFQLNRRTFVSRTTSWSASASVQAARNQDTLIDAFTGATFNPDPGWNIYYSGGIGLQQHRLFGVQGLRHSLNLLFNSQQIERRQFGDIDASREHVTASIESRVDYTIGRLALRAMVRSAKVGDRRVDTVSLRLQRSF